MNILFDQIIFLLAIAGLFFLPGMLFLAAFFRAKLPKISLFEYAIFSFALGLSLVDFGMLILSKAHIPFTTLSLLALTGVLLLIPACFLAPRFQKQWKHRKSEATKNGDDSMIRNMRFSKKEGFLFAGIFILTIFIKSVFLWNTILPTSTDLGHHMFWAKKIAIERTVPAYEKIEIDFKSGENTLTAPSPIDDFVVGEHLPFAAIAIVSGLDFVSAFPSLFLFLVNILTVLALALLAYRLFEDIFPTQTLARRGMIAVLLFAGPLWALSSPEAKYVSGGVVGNLLGNFLIPVIILSLFRALREKSAALLGLALLFAGTLAFTHHLSTLVFLFIALFVFFVFLIGTLFTRNTGNKKTNDFSELRSWLRLFPSPFPLFVIVSLLAITFFVYTPTYLHGSAIDTAIGAPSKESRAGLSFDQLAQTIGGSRLGLELVGIAILLLSPLRKTLGSAVLVAWSAGLIAMTLFPDKLFIDIPSNRIGTYTTFPAALLSGFALVALFMQKGERGSGDEETHLELQENSLLRWSFGIFLIAAIVGGFFDNAGSLPKENNAKEAVQTYAVSSWLVRNTRSDEWILKDHNYITADSWMKLFFMRDYSYPLSRGAFQRYTDEVTLREQCTLLMISAPNTPKGQACFKSTGVDTIVVNPHVDSIQFTKAKDLSLLYTSDDVAVYKKMK